MQIKDVMTTDYKWIAPETTVAEAAKIMQEKDYGYLAVGEKDRLIGSVTDRDFVVRTLAQGQDPKTAQVRDAMTAKVMYCYDDQSVDEICQNMAEVKVRRMPVVNREKRLVGVVSLGDLSRAQAQQTGKALQQITQHDNSAYKAA